MNIQLTPTEQYWIGWTIAITLFSVLFLTAQFFVIKMAILSVLKMLVVADQGRTIN